MGSKSALAGDEGAANRKQCEFQFVPVSLAPGGPATSRIATWLCYQGSPVGKTVQLLIHGATFNHSMWDFPLDPEHYSYVDYAIRRGYATLNLDRLGIGINDHPRGMEVDLYSNTWPEMADPAVMAMDDALKGTATEGEFGPNGAFVALQPQFSLGIHVPVLIAEGQDDEGSCGPELPCERAADILARESEFWSSAACLEAFVLPRSGHDMNAQYDAVAWFAHATDWIDRRIGRDADHPATQPCG